MKFISLLKWHLLITLHAVHGIHDVNLAKEKVSFLKSSNEGNVDAEDHTIDLGTDTMDAWNMGNGRSDYYDDFHNINIGSDLDDSIAEIESIVGQDIDKSSDYKRNGMHSDIGTDDEAIKVKHIHRNQNLQNDNPDFESEDESVYVEMEEIQRKKNSGQPLQIPKKQKLKVIYKRNRDRVLISKKIRKLLDDIVQLHFIKYRHSRVPWKELKPSYFVNWPDGVEIQNPREMKHMDIEKVLAIKNLEFKPDYQQMYLDNFIEKSKNKMMDVSHRPIQKSRIIVNEKLRALLDSIVNPHIVGYKHSAIPWKFLKPEYFTNWPDGVEIIQSGKMNGPDLQKILQVGDLEFQPEFKQMYVAKLMKKINTAHLDPKRPKRLNHFDV